jgi:hypothetical protein
MLLMAAPVAGAVGWRLVSMTGMGSRGIFLSGVSCTAASACTAVGDRYSATGADVGFVARWNGSRWTVETTPGPGGATNFAFNSIACASARRCVAAGQYGYDRSGDAAPFAANWTGGEWTARKLGWDTDDYADATARSVSCVALTDCFAAGFDTDQTDGGTDSTDYGDEQADIWRWNGRSWSGQNEISPGSPGDPDGAGGPDGSSPGNYAANSWFASLSCAGPSFCMGVGGAGPSFDNPIGDFRHADGLSLTTDGSNPAALTFKPRSWENGSGTNLLGASSAQINAVGCGSTTRCEVVGDTNGYPPAFAEGWNGRGWAAQSLPNAGGSNLGAISCPSADSCVAVGTVGKQVLVDVWNGTTWTTRKAVTPAGAKQVFTTAVSCTRTGACLLVGYVTRPAGVHSSFAERYS